MRNILQQHSDCMYLLSKKYKQESILKRWTYSEKTCLQQDRMSHFGLLTLSLVLCSLSQAAASEVYYITANSTDHCTVEPCLTLSQFAANSNHYLHSDNTTLVFLPGTHYLNTVDLTPSNVRGQLCNEVWELNSTNQMYKWLKYTFQSITVYSHH